MTIIVHGEGLVIGLRTKRIMALCLRLQSAMV